MHAIDAATWMGSRDKGSCLKQGIDQVLLPRSWLELVRAANAAQLGDLRSLRRVAEGAHRELT